MRAHDIIATIEHLAPVWLALPDDPVGLRAGDPNRDVPCVAVGLDADWKTVTQAIRLGAGMLVTHHPAFYNGLKSLDLRSADGRLASAILRNDLIVYSAHTNLDIASGGVNDAMAARLGLRDVRPLSRTETRMGLRKLVVFVPESHAEAVRTAVCQAGAGVIGNYSGCAWRVSGTGTFLGNEDANPAVGEKGRLETVAEVRLEMILPRGTQGAVLRALRGAHPYEEPAFDIYPVEDAVERGCGRVGALAEAMPLDAFAGFVRDTFGASHVRLFGAGVETVRTVAVWGGSGAPVGAAKRAGADALVAGEFRYHECALAEHEGLALVDLGHGVSEAVVLEPLAAHLRAAHPKLRVEVIANSFSAFRVL